MIYIYRNLHVFRVADTWTSIDIKLCVEIGFIDNPTSVAYEQKSQKESKQQNLDKARMGRDLSRS